MFAIPFRYDSLSDTPACQLLWRSNDMDRNIVRSNIRRAVLWMFISHHCDRTLLCFRDLYPSQKKEWKTEKKNTTQTRNKILNVFSWVNLFICKPFVFNPSFIFSFFFCSCYSFILLLAIGADYRQSTSIILIPF